MSATDQRHNFEEDAYQHLASIISSSNDAIISKSLDGTIRTWNPAAERIFGYTADEIIGKSILLLIPEDRKDDEDLILGKIRKGERLSHFETVRRKKDGTHIDVSITVSPMFDDKGEVIGASKIARDITERKRAQEQQSLLLGEMKHRAKNFQQILDVIARQSARDDPRSAEALNAFAGRVKALLITGEIVVDSEARTADLGEIFRRAAAPFQAKNAQTIVITGPPLEVSELTAGAFALAVHELATNAVKYGALRTPEGRVNLSWTREGNKVRITWKESSPSFVAVQPTRRGFGSRITATAAANEKDGRTELVYEPDGLRCTFEYTVALST